MVVRRLLFFLVLSHGVVFSKTNPLSKISVKSARAFTTPLKRDPGFHLVRYEQDVEVDLADKTKLTGEILEVVVSRKAAAASDAKKDKQKLASSTQQVKSVVLKGNVKITRANHIVKADKAELLVDKKQCIAQGNVHIAQTRKSTADMPVMIDSEKAVLDLSTEQLLLVGTDKAPVSTTFELK
ncbi:hypothetical protein FJ364_02620, partial [Candidatus Dependentiae bacterium]|nr:hypothetical protein [Candidatus Dependentiae bacterium]